MRFGRRDKEEEPLSEVPQGESDAEVLDLARCPHGEAQWDLGADGDVWCNVCGVLICRTCQALHGRHPDGRWRQCCDCPSRGSATKDAARPA